jgi:hypothetical protein
VARGLQQERAAQKRPATGLGSKFVFTVHDYDIKTLSLQLD